MYVITAHQRYGQTDRRTSSDPMTATLLKHVAVKKLYATLRVTSACSEVVANKGSLTPDNCNLPTNNGTHF